jgi:bifunctional non-homologous end joining protein LigD
LFFRRTMEIIIPTNCLEGREERMDFNPVTPFEPITTDRIPRGSNWVAQIKWDGVRMLFYYDGKETRLINRRLNDRTQQYPEFLTPSEYCSASSFILDGEMIAFDENKPSFHEVMKRDSLRKKQSIEQAVTRLPVTYMVFDILFLDGDWVISKTLAERQDILNSIIKPSPKVQTVKNFADPGNLFDLMKTHDMEGIICKNLESGYLIAGKDNRWQKRKIHFDLYAAVGGVTYNDKVINSLLLGVYSDESLLYIGHSGMGKLTNLQWRELTEIMAPLVIPNPPFVNRPERHKDAVWVHPQIVVKVQFMEWSPGKTMRHASIQSIMKNMSLSDCSINQI